jgi:heavy metal translocating P-type ATPase
MEATDSPNPEVFRETDLFKQCQAKGIIPNSEEELAGTYGRVVSGNGGTRDEASRTSSSVDPDTVLSLNLMVTNMWCPACAWVIDESLKKTDGVVSSMCNFSTDRLRVDYDPVKVTPLQIVAAISNLGYAAVEPGESSEATERRKEIVRFAISAFMTVNVMMLSYSLYTGFFADLSSENVAKISWPMFAMSTVVLIYGGYNFYMKAWAGLLNAAFSMETLIIIGALSAYIYSTANLFSSSIHLYYDTACMLITLVLLGKALERRAKNRVLSDLESFFCLMPTKVRICNNHFPEGRYVAAEQLTKGDVFHVNASEIVPADGRIITGDGSVDESSLTGEPLPVTKRLGDLVRSGTRIHRGNFKIKAEKVGVDSTLGQITEIIEKTLLTKTPLEGKTDVILQWFVPIILALALGTGVICRIVGLSIEASVLRAVTVMVISCPCALGIAIPLARVAGITTAGKKGMLVRDFSAFEQVEKINAFVFDKTGTITQGDWTLQETVPFAPFTAEQALALAAGLEKNADHFIGREIVRQAQQHDIRPAQVQNVHVGQNGLWGTFEGNSLRIGAFNFIAHDIKRLKAISSFADKKDTSNYSFVFLSCAERPVAVFGFGDRIRKGTKPTIKTLYERGYRLTLVSGDGDKATKAVGREIGIHEALGDKLPHDKVAVVKSIQDQHNQVAMVGDGINDAPALLQADLSLAMHSGGHLGKDVADVTLMRAEPEQIIDFLKFAAMVNKKIHQNLIFTFLYNVICIPVAMSGLLTPLVAVSAMLLSSITVIGNTLVLVRKQS